MCGIFISHTNLVIAKDAIFQIYVYYGESNLLFLWNDDEVCFVLDQHT